MKNNEFSFEDFFAAGTGNEPKQDSFVISTEGFDGYTDDLTASAEQAMEELDFLDSYEAVSRMNAETKIRMLQKIKNNYNSKTIGRENLGYSIESLCIEQIQSLEDAVEAPKEGEAAAEAPKETSEKKKGFFKTVFGAIAKFFQTIWKAITTAISKFVEWVKRGFAKKQAENTDAKTDMTNGEASANTSAATSADAGKAGSQLEKTKVWFDFSQTPNFSGATKFIASFVNYGKSVDVFFKKFDEACQKAKGSSAVTHEENATFRFTNDAFKNIATSSAAICNDLGLSVKNVNVSAGTSVKDAKKLFKELENSFSIDTYGTDKNNYSIYTTVNALFGIKRGDTKTINNTRKNSEKSRAEDTIKALANFEKNVFISKCDPVQKKLTEHANNMQKSIDARLDNNKNINDTTANMMAFQAALKFACKSEQYMSKLFAKLNSCAVQYAR